MQVQGHTLIGGWKLPDKFPDIFIWSPDIISWQDQQTLAAVPGIQPGTLLPVVVTTPAGDSKSNLLMASMMAGQNVGTMFFAVDPEMALRMIQLDFRDDNGIPLPPEEQAAAEARAVAEMKKPRRIVVTDEFRQARHLKVGDTYRLLTTVNGWQDYKICAVVWSPGADVLVSMYDLGHVLDQRTAGSVFGSIADAKTDFGVTGARLFAANLRIGVDKADLLKDVQKSMGDRGLAAGDVRQIKSGIESGFYRLLNLVSTVAVAAMALASLGVANTIMASVRSRRWQFGVLRSIGLGRGDLLRLILAEAVMLGFVGVALGLGAGLEISVDAASSAALSWDMPRRCRYPGASWPRAAWRWWRLRWRPASGRRWASRGPSRWNCCRRDARQSELVAMPKHGSNSVPFVLIIVGLLCVFVLTGWMAWRDKSETFDEPMHFVGAWLQTHFGDFRCDPGDPPLWRYYALLGISKDRLEVPTSGAVWDQMLSNRWAEGTFFKQVFYLTPGNDAVEVLKEARLRMLLLGAGAGGRHCLVGMALGRTRRRHYCRRRLLL